MAVLFVVLNYSLMAAWQACNRGCPTHRAPRDGWDEQLPVSPQRRCHYSCLCLLLVILRRRRRICFCPALPYRCRSFSCCHPRRGSAVALAVACSLYPKPKNRHFDRSCSRLCEQRSGEICFSIGSPEEAHSIAFTIAPIYFSPKHMSPPPSRSPPLPLGLYNRNQITQGEQH
jgi:hypothetical protein